MISLAARRHPGLAMRPALFLFALLMPLLLLVGCRKHGEWFQLEGVALDTGYHITLNGDLGEGDALLVEAAIQGALASLDSELAFLQAFMSRPPLPRPLAPAEAAGDERRLEPLSEHLQVLAVDRLFRVLDDFGIANALVELGGVQRASGMAGRHPWRVRLPRTGVGEPEEPVLRLQDAALVTRDAPQPQGGDAPVAARILGATVLAQDAEAADRLARKLLVAAPDDILEHPARLVVLTPRGIDVYFGSALEPLLEH